jgi:ribonuclease P protein component
VLARANRLVTADDFRTVLRRGRRIAADNTVASILETADGARARFGFIVTRKVGNAVKRNSVRRRMKAVAWELVDGGMSGADVVIRALPTAATADWAVLRTEITTAMDARTPR